MRCKVSQFWAKLGSNCPSALKGISIEWYKFCLLRVPNHNTTISQNIRMHNFWMNKHMEFSEKWPSVFCLSNVLHHAKTFKLKKDLHSKSWDIGFWNLGTYLAEIAGFSLLTGWKTASTHKPKNWLISLPTRKKFDASRLSAKKFYLPHCIAISML